VKHATHLVNKIARRNLAITLDGIPVIQIQGSAFSDPTPAIGALLIGLGRCIEESALHTKGGAL
jgi:hypothetical protein